MSQENREEVFDYFQQEERIHKPISARAYISGNLAHQLEEEEEEAWEKEQPRKAEPAKGKKIRVRNVPLWQRALILGGVLVIAAGLLRVAMSYSFTACRRGWPRQSRTRRFWRMKGTGI